MNNISRTLKRWVQNSNMTLDDMAHKVFERGWSEYRVLTYDELKEHRTSFSIIKIIGGIK